MKPEILIIFSMFFGFAFLEFIFTRFFSKAGQKSGDGTVELISTGTLLLLTQPFVILGGMTIAGLVFPSSEGIIATWPFIAVFGLFLIFDDMTQYWWHRASHSIPWLYKLHRPHHNAEYLSIRVVYRNNIFYYLLMPGIWLSGVLIYLGGGAVYSVYIIIKLAVIYGAHSDVRWDEPLQHPPLIVHITASTSPMVSPITKAISATFFSFGMSFSVQQKLRGNIRHN